MTKHKKIPLRRLLLGIGIFTLSLGAGFGLSFIIRPNTVITEEKTVEKEVKVNDGTSITLTETPPVNVFNDKGELDESAVYPYVDSVDGGQFLDGNGLSAAELDDGGFKALGAIESVDVSSPEAFVRSTLYRCIIADNYFGAQCVSLQRAFWWSYAGYDITTCGTGVAKGEALCP